jgi:hypothetical protein
VIKKFYPHQKLKNILAESPLFLLREAPENPNKWEVAVN